MSSVVLLGRCPFMMCPRAISSHLSLLSRTANQVNLHDIKNSFHNRPSNNSKTSRKWNAKKGLRWNAINARDDDDEDANNNNNTYGGGASEGLWNALPLFGGGTDHNTGDDASIKSGPTTSSKYRDEEGEKLLHLASKRLNNRGNNNRDSAEYGEVNNSEEEEELNHKRVFLDKQGNLSYNQDGYDDDDASLHSRRMRNAYKRAIAKRPCICILGMGVAICLMALFGVLSAGWLNGMVGRKKSGGDGDGAEGIEERDNDAYKSGEEGDATTHIDGAIGAGTSDRFQAIKSKLLSSEASLPSAFHDTKSAQYAALTWLANDDPRQLDATSEYLVQRYGLLVLWFATTETEYEWHVPEEYVKDNSDGNRKLDALANGESKWTRHESWLSELGICGWEGIKCHPNPNDGDDSDHNGNSDGDVSRIEMRKNNIHGLIPSEIYRTLPRLEYADMSDNGFTGTISIEIGRLKQLQQLNFTANRIGGSLPNEIGGMSSLEVLHLAENLVGESIPEAVGSLLKLRDLDLSGNNLKGTIPYSMGVLEDLISLNLCK